MSTDTNLGPLLRGLDSSLTSVPQPQRKKNNNQVDQNEFLQLLVTQLKNQDPLNPMENDRFAVDLAQFSQLEQLVAIKDKIGATSGGGDLTSLSSYLGMQVALDSDRVSVAEGDGGLIRVALPDDAQRVTIQLLDGSGAVRKELTLEQLARGRHTIQLSELGIADGDYQLRVSALGRNGGDVPVTAHAAGIVTGFIPGPDPSLIVNGREVKPGDLKEVSLPPVG